MSYPIDISASRIRLREWAANEADSFYRWIADPVVNKFLTWGVSSRSESDAQFAELLEAHTANPRIKYFLALELVEAPGITIGDAGFTWVERNVAEIGYFLETAYWGNGYATEAAHEITDLAFELGAKHVIASCFAGNTASENVMKRCGMELQKTSDPTRLVYKVARTR